MKHIGRIVRPFVSALSPEYRVVLAPQGSPRPYRVEVRSGDAWVFARWAKSEVEGQRIINGIYQITAAQIRARS